MKVIVVLVFFCTQVFAQSVWHVKPYGGNLDSSISKNDGKSLATAWTLHEALTNVHLKIEKGDVIYLHGGIYKGHFTCTLEGKSWKKDEYISVKNYPGETAVIDGYIHDGKYAIPKDTDETTILKVLGKYVHFEGFRVTCLGDFTRITDNENCNPKDKLFHNYTGILHDPEFEAPCRFVNLIIDNIPGVGFASWKESADSEIYGCLMYYNGYIKSLRKTCAEKWDMHDADSTPSNVVAMENCIYTQNTGKNGKVRLISNNIFSNNYKSGVAIWSAEKNPGFDYLSNYRVEKNIFVNNAAPVRGETPNMLISSDTRNEHNFARNIEVVDNVFYFNSSNDISGITTLRNHNVRIENNEFYNGTAAVELNATNKKMTFSNNLYVGKRIKISAKPSDILGNGNSAHKWTMQNNTYHTTNPGNLFMTANFGGITLTDFQRHFKTENKSSMNAGKLPVQRNIFQNKYNPNRFHLTYYNKDATAGTISFDFFRYKIPDGMRYIIRDAEDYHNPIATGKFDSKTGIVTAPVSATPGFELPRPSKESGKTAYVSLPVHSKANFRVFVIEFGCDHRDDLTISKTTVPSSESYAAQNRLSFENGYIADENSKVNATAGNEILFTGDCTIKSGNGFLAKIDKVECPTIKLLSDNNGDR